MRRHEQQLHAALHPSLEVDSRGARVTVLLDIVPDEDNPYALLSALDQAGIQLAAQRVSPGFKLSRASATAWADSGFVQP